MAYLDKLKARNVKKIIVGTWEEYLSPKDKLVRLCGGEELVESKIREWRRQGYSSELINMALKLAYQWAYKVSATYVPPERVGEATKYNLPKSLDVADKWIKAVG